MYLKTKAIQNIEFLLCCLKTKLILVLIMSGRNRLGEFTRLIQLSIMLIHICGSNGDKLNNDSIIAKWTALNSINQIYLYIQQQNSYDYHQYINQSDRFVVRRHKSWEHQREIDHEDKRMRQQWLLTWNRTLLNRWSSSIDAHFWARLTSIVRSHSRTYSRSIPSSR